MKLCAAQIKPVAGDIQSNITRHKKIINLAVRYGADLIIFPELSITGYEPHLAKKLATTKDDTRFDEFQDISDSKKIVIGIGIPTRHEAGICISMIIFQPFKKRIIYSKRYLHPDEEPFFVSGENFPYIRIDNTNIGLAICYELSIPEHSENAFSSGAEIYFASVAKSASGMEKAKKILSELAGAYLRIVLLSNSVGPSDDFISAGKSAIWNNKGLVIEQLEEKEEGILIVDTDTGETFRKTIPV